MSIVETSAHNRNTALDSVSLSPFENIARLLAERPPGALLIPLHQGKTAFTTPVDPGGCDASGFDLPAHHDGPTAGAPSLLAALVDRVRGRTGLDLAPDRVQITAGITHALSIAFHSLLAPGDEVVLLSPQWLFVTGLVRAAHGVPVEVPWFTELDRCSTAELLDRLGRHITSRTRALYLNVPNNPTGRSMPADQLRAVLDLTADRDLWIVADNAYEHYDFREEGFTDPLRSTRSDRVFAAYSFSKTHGMTGYRIGYLVSPAAMAETARKHALYSVYSTPTVVQYAALSALRQEPGVLAEHRAFVAEAMRMTTEDLEVPALRPTGGFYAFLDLSGWPHSSDEFIARCVAAGVSLAPGRAFGTRYGHSARLCFAVVDHAALAHGIEIVNRVHADSGVPARGTGFSSCRPRRPEFDR